MSIQLDGKITYPEETEGHLNGNPTAITWEGLWHYSQKQSTCGFKYVFLGMEDSGCSQDGEKNEVGSPGLEGGSGVNNSKEKDSKGAGVVGGVDCPLAVDTSRSALPIAELLKLYGPSGDGRLPSGRWAGEFVVKGKGREMTVQEEFHLDFGTGRSPRTSTQPQGQSGGQKDVEPRGTGEQGGTDGGEGTGVGTGNTTGAQGVGTDSGSGVHRESSGSKNSNESIPPPVAISPVVRVSGRGSNRYGDFTLMGGHERATGRLDLTRIYLVVKTVAAPQSTSHQKKRRPLPPGAPVPEPPGPSLAERRTKRSRCPSMYHRMYDTEGSQHVIEREATGSLPSGHPESLNGGAGSGEGGGSDSVVFTSQQQRGKKPQGRPVDQERRGGRRKSEGGGGGGKGGRATALNHDGYNGGGNPAAVAALVAGGRVNPNPISGADLSALIGTRVMGADDTVLKEALVNMEREQAGLEAAAAEEAAMAMEEVEAAARAAEELRSGTEGGKGGRRGKGAKPPGDETWKALYYDEDSGECYEGGWWQGKRDGDGLCVYVNGNIYEGEWRMGKEHGRGVLMAPNRSVIYQGEFADGKLCGKGSYRFVCGDVYEGEWKDNLRHGRGVYVRSQGTRYEGEFKDNARCGRGCLRWPDGSSYDGEWLNDMKHGRGTLKLSNKFVYEGQWAQDVPEGRGTCTYEDGQTYEGMFRGGKKDGRGTLVFANGASYEGRFRDDAIEGSGGTMHMPRPCEDGVGGWMIPFQADLGRTHLKAGFDRGGF